MSELDLLISLGLKEVEAKIYLALLKNESSSSIRSLANLTKINRGLVYESLKNLVSFGLVSFVRQGERRNFFAESPEKVYDMVSKKKSELINVEKSAKDLIPNLLAYKKDSSGTPLVRFYEDREGIALILNDVLHTAKNLENKEYYLYSSLPLRRFMYKSFPNFTRNRIKDNIFVKVLAVGNGGDPAELSERKWLPGPHGKTPSSYTLIYGEKVALISLSANKTPYGVIIEEPGLATMQKYLFEALWSKL